MRSPGNRSYPARARVRPSPDGRGEYRTWQLAQLARPHLAARMVAPRGREMPSLRYCARRRPHDGDAEIGRASDRRNRQSAFPQGEAHRAGRADGVAQRAGKSDALRDPRPAHRRGGRHHLYFSSHGRGVPVQQSGRRVPQWRTRRVRRHFADHAGPIDRFHARPAEGKLRSRRRRGSLRRPKRGRCARLDEAGNALARRGVVLARRRRDRRPLRSARHPAPNWSPKVWPGCTPTSPAPWPLAGRSRALFPPRSPPAAPASPTCPPSASATASS